MLGDQLEETLVLLVERVARVDAGDDEDARALGSRARHGQDDGGRQRLREWAGVNLAEPLREVGEHERGAPARGGVERPRSCGVERHRVGCRVRPAFQARRRHETCLAVSVAGDVEEDERNVGSVPNERLARIAARLLDRLGVDERRDQVAQGDEPALGQDALGGLVHDAEDSANLSRLVEDRAVREREVALLEVAAPIEGEEPVVERDGLALEDAIEHRSDGVPELGKTLFDWTPHRRRMFSRAQDGAVGVVVKEQKVRPPEDAHGEARGQRQRDERAQRRRPLPGRTERGLLPARAPHDFAALAATGKALVGLDLDRAQPEPLSLGRYRVDP